MGTDFITWVWNFVSMQGYYLKAETVISLYCKLAIKVGN